MSYRVGEKVTLLYDGKYTRAVEAEIIKIGPNGEYIRVKFVPWTNKETGPVELKLKQHIRRKNRYSGHLKGRGELGIMRFLGSEGDYYRVVKLEEVTNLGYKVE